MIIGHVSYFCISSYNCLLCDCYKMKIEINNFETSLYNHFLKPIVTFKVFKYIAYENNERNKGLLNSL